MKVIFLGTSEFSVKVLDGINCSCHTVVGVVTQPDRINTRGNKTVYCAVKEYAIKNGLPVFQYENISRDGEIELAALHADIMVTCAYGQILKQNILDICPNGIINVHASLLPKYRGSSPVQWALINGEKTVGVSIMQTELGIDTGAVIVKDEITLSGDESSAETLDLLSSVGAKLIVNALDMIENNTAVYIPQDNSLATHCKMLSKADGHLDFNKTALEIKNFVRGMTPWPTAYTSSENGILKFLKVDICECDGGSRFGEIVVADPKNGLIVKCAEGYIRVLYIQGENSKAMDIRSYLLGKKLTVGRILGE